MSSKERPRSKTNCWFFVEFQLIGFMIGSILQACAYWHQRVSSIRSIPPWARSNNSRPFCYSTKASTLRRPARLSILEVIFPCHAPDAGIHVGNGPLATTVLSPCPWAILITTITCINSNMVTETAEATMLNNSSGLKETNSCHFSKN